MPLTPINSPDAPPAIGPYSQAMACGGLIFVSGQLPLDPTGKEIAPGSGADQLQVCLANAELILAQAGVSRGQVVKTTIFVTDMEEFKNINAVYAAFFGNHKPARSVIEVSGLPRGANVEIELIAAA